MCSSTVEGRDSSSWARRKTDRQEGGAWAGTCDGCSTGQRRRGTAGELVLGLRAGSHGVGVGGSDGFSGRELWGRCRQRVGEGAMTPVLMGERKLLGGWVATLSPSVP